MKNRIIFMTLHQQLLDDLQQKGIDRPELHLQSQGYVRWNGDFIAEECLWSLESYLTKSPQYFQRPPAAQVPSSTNTPEKNPQGPSSHSAAQTHLLSVQPPNDSPPQTHAPAQPYVSIPMPQSDNPVQTSTSNQGPGNPFAVIDRDALLEQLLSQRKSHFRNPVRDGIFFISSWIVLLLAIPATIAGYIGSFTLASNSTSNGPAIWLGVEVALSIVRILIWAWNPGWDEKTDFVVHLELTEHEPLVTTEKDVDLLDNILPLIPEQRFLEFIKSYTGPLEQFKGHPNIVLYFTLSGAEGRKRLFMTVLDANQRVAFVVYRDMERIVYTNCSIDPDTERMGVQATLLSEIGDNHPWKINYPFLRELTDHYDSLLCALNRVDLQARRPVDRRTQRFTKVLASWLGRWTSSWFPPTIPSPPIPSPPVPPPTSSLSPPAISSSLALSPSAPPLSVPLLVTRWSFEAKVLARRATQHGSLIPRPLSEHDNLYLQRGYEHHLKTRLMTAREYWFVQAMEVMRSDALIDCHFVNEEPMTNERGKQLELDLLETWMAVEWQKHGLALLKMSVGLEEVLDSRMEEHIETVVKLKEREWMRDWFSLEWSAGQKKRLEGEWAQARRRMEIAAKQAMEGNMDNAREWWRKSQEVINEAWKTVIAGGIFPEPPDELPVVFFSNSDSLILEDIQRIPTRRSSPLHDIRNEMGDTVKRIRDVKGIKDGNLSQLDEAYSVYSLPRPWAVYSRFVNLRPIPPEHRLLAAKLSVGTVYDVTGCDPAVVDAVIQNRFARTVVGVENGLTIKENDRLLYLGDTYDDEIVRPFIQRNRDYWWTQQTTNSSTFYFTPTRVLDEGAIAYGKHTIARLMIFLGTPARLRIRLLHHRYEPIALSILEGGIELRRIRNSEIPHDEPRLCSFALKPVFEVGKHELELVVIEGSYVLQNILVEFIDDGSSPPPPLPV